MQLIFFGDNQYGQIVADALKATGKFVVTPYSPTTTIDPDSIGVVASYGHILPPELIKQFPRGIVCLHPSLLPEYRGATPGPYAIALGDKETGITLFRLTEKIDQGEIIAQAKEPIHKDDTTPTLLTRLFSIGVNLLIDWLTDKPTHRPTDPLIHRNTKQIFTRRFTKETGYIEWQVVHKMLNNEPITPKDTNNYLLALRLNKQLSLSPIIHNSFPIIHDLIRALTPWPGVWTTAETKKGPLRLTITQVNPTIMVKIEGKPKSISWNDFATYYL